MSDVVIILTDATEAAARKFAAERGMSLEGYLIATTQAVARARTNPLHAMILHLVAQGFADGEIASQIGMDQTATSVGRIRRQYHLPANPRYVKAGS